MHENDPLWKLRHALAGVALALLASVFIAAMAGAALGDAFGGDYGLRAAAYSLLLAYVVTGAAVLFVKVARHETRPVSAGRVARWIASLWLWPVLLALASRRSAPAASEAAVPPAPGSAVPDSPPAAPGASSASRPPDGSGPGPGSDRGPTGSA